MRIEMPCLPQISTMPPIVLSLTTLKGRSDCIHYPADMDDLTCSMPKSTRPKAQDDQSAVRHKEEHDAMDSAVDEWISSTLVKAAELSERFDKKPHYFLDRFFVGGQKLIYKQNVTNSFNTFKSIKAAQLRSGTFSCIGCSCYH